MTKRIEISEAELRRLYEEEELSQRRIAKILGCSRATIQSRMQEYGIKSPTKAEAAIIARSRGKQVS